MARIKKWKPFATNVHAYGVLQDTVWYVEMAHRQMKKALDHPDGSSQRAHCLAEAEAWNTAAKERHDALLTWLYNLSKSKK